jgi:dolichol-phosphate mannosyltransferase
MSVRKKVVKAELSIIVPVYNEEKSIALLVKKIQATKGLPKSFELIFVNDGSTDKSELIIEKFAKRNKKIKLISLMRNFGQQSAITAGLKHSMGQYVGIMDADLQDPPAGLIKMYKIAKKRKVDVVYATRQNRKENISKKLAYKFFYKLYLFVSEFPTNRDSGDFSVLNRDVVDHINNMPENVRFIRGLRSWTGCDSLAYPINRLERVAGKPKYTWSKLISLAIKGITSTSTRPLKMATALGLTLSATSFMIILVYFVRWIAVNPHEKVPGFATLVVLILFFSGLQLFALGILGEYIATIFLEVKGRPDYLVKKKVNL